MESGGPVWFFTDAWPRLSSRPMRMPIGELFNAGHHMDGHVALWVPVQVPRHKHWFNGGRQEDGCPFNVTRRHATLVGRSAVQGEEF